MTTLPGPQPRLHLPTLPTTFIGREREVAAVTARLRDPGVHLLTLTGPGGTGKTRLAIQTAARLGDAFPDGVYFVPLAPITDPSLILPAIALELGVHETGAQPLPAHLQTYLRARRLLLVLDNFEQVVAAARHIGDLLAAAPQVKALVTSREILHLYGEAEFPVPPLALPDPAQRPALEQLTQYEAVQLFIRRARAARPDFQVTNETAPAVAEICRRLDGLPLALELAAARIKLFAPPALLARLDRRLPLLTGGARDLPARHQTLHNAITWSYDLLEPDEQRLFRRLAVFAGGCTLDAAERVGSGQWAVGSDEVGGDDQHAIRNTQYAADPHPSFLIPHSSVLAGLSALLDKSLLRQDAASDGPLGGEARFVMLATIREYALERLNESGEAPTMQQRHAEFFLALAGAAGPQLRGHEQGVWQARLDREHDNLRAALAWAWSGAGPADLGLRLAVALTPFWIGRGYYTEGRRWVDGAVAHSGAAAPSLRAAVLSAAGNLTYEQGDMPRATALLEESVRVHRALNDPAALALALKHLGNVRYMTTEVERARELYEESLAIWRAQDNQREVATLLNNLGAVTQVSGDYPRATAFFTESLALVRKLGDRRSIANALSNLGEMALIQGDHACATALYEECLAVRQEIGSKPGVAYSYGDLAAVAQSQGDYARATALAHQSLALHEEISNKIGRIVALSRLGELAYLQHDYEQAGRLLRESLTQAREFGIRRHIVHYLNQLAGLAGAQLPTAEGAMRAARLFGAAAALQQTLGIRLTPPRQAALAQRIAELRPQVEAATWAAAWAAGEAMPLAEAIALALQDLPAAPPTLPTPAPISSVVLAALPPAPPRLDPPPPPAGLTARETEVLRLLAGGLSNAEIAGRLNLSTNTIQVHLRSIFSKIGVTTRSAATRYAVEHGLT